MLAAAQRLHTTKEIETIYRRGKKVYHPLLRLLYLPSALPYSRATVIVSQRVSRLAVERNTIKRRLRASLRAHLPQLKTRYDIRLIAQTKAKHAKSKVLDQTLDELLQQQQLYCSLSK